MRLSGRETESWLAGQAPDGATYFAGEQVRVRNAGTMRTGTVLLLTELEPEPRYLIELELGRGHYLQAPQSTMARA